MDNNERVVIIGAGQAGGRLALALKDSGFQGDVHLIGQENSPPYNRPPLSKAVLLGKKPVEKTYLAGVSDYPEKGIDLHTGCTVTSVNTDDRKVTCSNGNSHFYTHLVFATGSYPRPLKLPGSTLPGITTFRTDTDSIELSQKLTPGSNLVIVGGGFIGLEIAASARELDCNVTVLEAQPRLMTRSMPASAAADVHWVHEQFGVEILTGVGITGFTGTHRVEAVELADGRRLKADNVVIGIGIIADTHLAEQTGLECRNGVVTDAFNQTSIDNIYALGDCASTYLPRYEQHIRLESSQNADLQAASVAKTILGDPQAYDPVPWLWSQQYNWVIQTAGFTHDADQIVNRGRVEDECVLYFALKNGQLLGVVGIGKGATVAREVRMAQLLIEQAKPVKTSELRNQEIALKDLLTR